MKTNKISGKHSSLIDDAVLLVRYLVKFEEVKKVSPGIIINSIGRKRDNTTRVKLVVRATDIEAKISSNNAIQKLRIYAQGNKDDVVEIVEKFTESNDWGYRVMNTQES
jgi:hypothetical protein